MGKESRTFVFEMRKEGESRKMVGHAAVFNQEADIGGWFKEVIEPGAFVDTIKDDDVRALFNHDENFPLGRNIAGTLSLSEDDTGLKVEIDPPDTQYARDLAVSIERGDISQMSFAFQTLKEEWQFAEAKGDMDLRRIKKVRLFDVSPVTFPAYEGTDIALRSRDERKKELKPEPPAEPKPAQRADITALRRHFLLRRA